MNRCEAAFERGIGFNVLFVFLLRGCADAADFAACQRGFENVRRVKRPRRRAGADDGVNFVDEKNNVAFVGHVVDNLRETRLEISAIHGACDERGHVEAQHAVRRNSVGDVALGDAFRETFDDRRFSDAGFAYEQRIVFCTARKHIDDALDLRVAADDRIDRLRSFFFREIVSEKFECGRCIVVVIIFGMHMTALFTRFSGRLGLHVVFWKVREARRRLKNGSEVVADNLVVDVLAREKRADIARGEFDEAIEQVFGADVAVRVHPGREHGFLNHALGIFGKEWRGVRRCGRRDCVEVLRCADEAPQRVRGRAGLAQNFCADRAVLGTERPQKMRRRNRLTAAFDDKAQRSREHGFQVAGEFFDEVVHGKG